MSAFLPTSPRALAEQIVTLCGRFRSVVVVAIDGADCARPQDLAALVADAAQGTDRPSTVVSLHDYVKPASLRFEHGHEDPLSYRTIWFDYAALDREVVTAARTTGTWLPALWNEAADRSARSSRRTLHDRQVIVVAGPMLLGRGLSFDVTVSLVTSEAAMRRNTATGELWTVDAVLGHVTTVTERPDLEVRYDHPERPAVRTHLGL